MLKNVAAFDRIGEENAFAVLARAMHLAAAGRYRRRDQRGVAGHLLW